MKTAGVVLAAYVPAVWAAGGTAHAADAQRIPNGAAQDMPQGVWIRAEVKRARSDVSVFDKYKEAV